MVNKPKTALYDQPVPSVDVAVTLMRVSHRLERALAPVAEEAGITMQQFNVLRVLYVRGGEEGLPCSEIGGRLIQRVPDVTRLLDRLEKEGLIERVRCDRDRRVVRSRLTDRGQALVERIHGPLTEKHEALVAHMSPRELSQLQRLLLKLGGPLDVTDS